jgi:monooxygenase
MTSKRTSTRATTRGTSVSAWYPTLTFEEITAGRVSIVTDQIESFTENGIALASGNEIEADLIVAATGLSLQALGGIELSVDREPIEVPNRLAYRGAMLDGVPNLAFAFGYVNQSWTLGADVTCQRVCRLLNYMDERGYDTCTPRSPGHLDGSAPFWELSSGYVRRGGGLFPRQGSGEPWYRPQSYPRDRRTLSRGPLDDGVLEFARLRQPSSAPSDIAA